MGVCRKRKTKEEKLKGIAELGKLIAQCTDPEERRKLMYNRRHRRYRLYYYERRPEKLKELREKRRKAAHNRAKKKYHRMKRRLEQRAREKARRRELREKMRGIREAQRKKQHAAEVAKRKAERKKAAAEMRKRYWMVAIATNNNIRSCVGEFREREPAVFEFENLKRKLGKEPDFPKAVRNHKGFADYKSEVLLLRKKEKLSDKSNKFLRNEYGELVEHEITGEFGEKWLIWNKFQFREEETFSFVPGQKHYHTDRKTLGEIWDEFVVSKIPVCDGFVGIQKYRNKIIFRDGFKAFEVVFCKTKDDCARAMKKLEEKGSDRKIAKKVVFMDEVDKTTASSVLDELMELTGYTRERIKRVTTQH